MVCFSVRSCSPLRLQNKNRPVFLFCISRRQHFEFIVGRKTQSRLKLEKVSSYLARFHSHTIEIPGQYLADQEPSVDQHVVCFMLSLPPFDAVLV
jgi:hypothetical protein